MANIFTKYGYLEGVESISFYLSNDIESCVLNKENNIKILDASLVPKYKYNNRRKEIPSISFYEEGDVKSISLEQPTIINTKAGIFMAEKINFYKDNIMKSLFLLEGKLTAYWTEDDEYKRAQQYSLKFDFGEFFVRLISLHFYPSGSIKSFTLWPKEEIMIDINNETFIGRIGLAFYEDGSLKSFEPKVPAKIKTKIGTITAFDVNAIGLNGSNNSIEFYKDKTIKSLVTSNNMVKVLDYDGKLINEYKPTIIENHIIGDIEKTETIKVEFYENMVILNDDRYELDKYSFLISKVENKYISIKNNCSKCGL